MSVTFCIHRAFLYIMIPISCSSLSHSAVVLLSVMQLRIAQRVKVPTYISPNAPPTASSKQLPLFRPATGT